MKKLSNTMLLSYKNILELPFVEFKKIGNSTMRYWVSPDCEFENFLGYDRPLFEIRSQTIEALYERGLLQKIDSDKDFYNSKYKALYNENVLSKKPLKINSKEYLKELAFKYDLNTSKDCKYFNLYVHGNPDLFYFKSKGHGAVFGIELKEHFNKYKKLDFNKIFKLTRRYFETLKDSLDPYDIYKTFYIYHDRIELFDPASNARPELAKIIKIDNFLLN